MRVALLVFVVVLGYAAPIVPATADDGDSCDLCTTTTGDQGAGAVVTDGAHHDGSAPHGDLGAVMSKNKDCTDCEWAVSPACTNASPTSTELCVGATMGCADPQDLRYLLYLRHGAGPWVLQGTICLGPRDRPATVADIGQVVRERVVNYLPDAHPSFQPRAGGIVNLPTLFAAGEPKHLRTDAFDVLGFTVVVTADARWDWTFDGGATEEFSEPGGGYPNQSVSHTYAAPGERRVGVTTYWRAQYTVNGDGPFPVPGPELSKTAGPFRVPVRAAHAELVGR